MRIGYYLILTLCLVLAACNSSHKQTRSVKKAEQPSQIIYCTPQVIGTCLPLEIVCDDGEWTVRYVGVADKELSLAPKSINEEGHGGFALQEYVNEKPNGTYVMRHGINDPEGFFTLNDECCYLNAKGEEMAVFGTVAIKEDDIIINPFNIGNSMKIITAYEESYVHQNPERCVQNLAYLMHANPKTLQHDFSRDSMLYVSTSADGKLRTYLFDYYLGGNGAASHNEFGMIQYQAGNEVAVLDDMTDHFYLQLQEFGNANFAHACSLRVMQAGFQGRTYYLIEAIFSDSQPMPFQEDSEYCKVADCALFAFTLERGKLTPTPILGGKPMLEVVSSNWSEDLHYKYDAGTQEILMPKADPKTHAFEGEFTRIKLK